MKASSRQAPVTSRSLKGDVAADEVPRRGVGVERNERHSRSADLHVGDALQPVIALRLGVGHHETEVAGRHRGLERGPGPVGDDPAVVDHNDPIRNLIGLFEVMGGEDDGPSLLAELAHHSPERPTAVDIHGHGRLVQEDQFRIPGDGQGEADPLGFAPGQVVGAASEERSDAGALDGRLERSGTAVEPPDEGQGPRSLSPREEVRCPSRSGAWRRPFPVTRRCAPSSRELRPSLRGVAGGRGGGRWWSTSRRRSGPGGRGFPPAGRECPGDRGRGASRNGARPHRSAGRGRPPAHSSPCESAPPKSEREPSLAVARVCAS
jgi:hypothetical protein